jgi:phosphomannomutase
MLGLLRRLREQVVIGFVGGSNLVKQQEQLGANVLDLFDYGFAENGLTAYRLGQPLESASFIGYMGEERYSNLVNGILRHIANLDIPRKRGTFIEFRTGMINVSPIGRNCSHQERMEFEQYDKQHGIRTAMIQALQQAFPDYGLTYVIGGQISFDVFPSGWDKTYCLRHIEGEGFDKVYFFGDKTHPGGNDHEIYTHPQVQGHTVTSPADTARIVTDLFFSA